MHKTHPQKSQQTKRKSASQNLLLGARGEDLAAEYLGGQGYTIIARNWRFGRLGELDIVAADGQTLVAIEVKTRSSNTHGTALEAITPLKAQRLRTLLYHWLRNHHANFFAVRIDAIGITLKLGEQPQIEHIRGIS